jgi:GT2 family glycosyltransferase
MIRRMLISVIICTYRRADDVRRAIECLVAQTHRDFEVLVVDGSGKDPVVREAVAALVKGAAADLDLELIESPAGLTRQRNAGLGRARGDLICFLDDDVTVDARFLETVRELFDSPDMHDVGGLTGFDQENYPQPVSWRWKMRSLLGTTPGLQPGIADRLGRHAPLSFVQQRQSCLRVGWLPGFCMIYRRESISDLRFDESLPTYGGEDRDFSFAVGERWRLLLCGALLLRHHTSPTARSSAVRRVYETGFGTGRTFAKRARGVRDSFAIAHYIGCEFLLDVAAFARRPSIDALRMPFARARGIFAGLSSLPRDARARLAL